MPNDMPIAEMPVEQAPVRPDRKDIVAFVTDLERILLLRQTARRAAGTPMENQPSPHIPGNAGFIVQ